ncbi:hypothetical protein CcI49_11720 [Frankia sp. CcI49]|nr:hypothetical protein CcI49_11720 [Frankia sp. CcI49]
MLVLLVLVVILLERGGPDRQPPPSPPNALGSSTQQAEAGGEVAGDVPALKRTFWVNAQDYLDLDLDSPGPPAGIGRFQAGWDFEILEGGLLGPADVGVAFSPWKGVDDCRNVTAQPFPGVGPTIAFTLGSKVCVRTTNSETVSVSLKESRGYQYLLEVEIY